MVAADALARAAIRRLRSGIVPDWEIERLSVGYRTIHQEVERALERLRQKQNARALFVRGEWGTGKSHLLTYVRAVASRADSASAWVDLNARSAALNYPQRFYPVVAETLRAGDDVGLKAILISALRDPAKRLALRAGNGFEDLRWPIYHLINYADENRFGDLSGHWAWTILLGGDIASSDYTYKRRQATARVGALGGMLRSIGFNGLVLLFDEAETIDQLWNIRSRLTAYDVLGRLCQMDSIWCVFGVTERFDRTIQTDRQRGVLDHGLASQDAEWFLRSWTAGRFAVIQPPTMDLRSAKEISRAVEKIYEAGYAGIEEGTVERCVEEWNKNPARNPRRLIRLLVHRFDVLRAIPRTARQRAP